MKSITIPNITDELYYKVLELKAKLKAKDWQDFLTKITEEKR